MPQVLFDIGHPAHVHLFKNARQVLVNRGYDVYVLARDKEVTRQLLDAYQIQYIPGTKKRNGFLSLLELFEWFVKARKIIKCDHIDVVASIGSPAGAWAAKVCNIPHIAFNDTETARKQRMLYKPASTKIFTPSCLLSDFGSKQVRYNGTHDLAYLRPEWFNPDISVRKELYLNSNETYAILRFVSWQATHDWHKKGTDTDFQRAIVSIVSKKHRVFISAEGVLPPDLERFRLNLPPERLHDAMACAAAVIGDGSTTLTEAAALGVPALYISQFAGFLGCLRFYEKYGLLRSVKTKDEGINEIQILLKYPDPEGRTKRRMKMLDETIDVATYIADQCEKYFKYEHSV